MSDIDLSRALAICPTIDVGSFAGLKPPEPRPRLVIDNANAGDIQFGNDVVVRGTITMKGSDNLITVGDRCRLGGPTITIEGNRCTVVIGPRVKTKGCRIQVTGDDCLVVIGAETTWESGSVICHGGKAVIIGNDCMISNSIMIRTNDGHGIWDNKSGALINEPADVFIDHHVWVGNGARINKGARIGMGGVLGQCAVVSGKTDPECIYAGVPARKIKSDIHWSRRLLIDEMPEQYRLKPTPEPATVPNHGGSMMSQINALLAKARARAITALASGSVGAYAAWELLN